LLNQTHFLPVFAGIGLGVIAGLVQLRFRACLYRSGLGSPEDRW
jgi:hypothetical protein